MIKLTGSYSADDNKLRLRASARLDAELYKRVRAAGFIWAPKQDLFVAPKWTPEREDLLLELCEEIEDEDISLVDRATERAERFEDYSDRREADAHAAHAYVESITSGIPLGQPILVRHHSERHARKDAQRIENGMRKAVNMWETSKYWERRAAGAIRAAKYKELPTVRARRIKTLEAELRKFEKSGDIATKLHAAWTAPDLTVQRAKSLANFGHTVGLWSDLDGDKITAEQARDRALPGLSSRIEYCGRFSEHLKMRLIYERCMLEESGYVEEPKQKSAKQTLPLCNYRAKTIKSPSRYHRGQIDELPQVEMTKAEYAKIYKDYKGTRIVDNSHKVRIAVIRSSYVAVFLTDYKVHVKPSAGSEQPPPAPRMPRPAPRPAPEPTVFDAMKQSLKAGVQVVSAPQLFPTPRDLAAKMVALAEIGPEQSVLEPSAGTGRILEALEQAVGIDDRLVTAVEIDALLVQGLEQRFNREWRRIELHQADFLTFAAVDPTRYDVALINPPFANAQDIAHILAALGMLKPGGRVVALCANGPRQQAQLKPLAESWEELPAGSFAAEGTNVNVVLATFSKP